MMLGTGEPEAPYWVESFRLDEVRYYVRRAARRLEVFAADLPLDLMPEPCSYCGKCEWSAACEECWEAADHLCRVADITRKQIRRLGEADVSTLSMLASLDAVRVAGIAPETIARLVQQARLQRQSSTTASGAYETIAHLAGLGFDRLPMIEGGATTLAWMSAWPSTMPRSCATLPTSISPMPRRSFWFRTT